MISMIVPCYWNSRELLDMTKRCLGSLRYQRPDELIVVDDGSPVKSIISTIVRKQNGGYAAAVNTGLKKAKGDILIVSNNDIIFTPGWLDAILKPIYEEWDISSIRTSDQTWETENKITDGDKFGSLWAMKREVYDTIGGLDETFGNYFEDLDFQKRAEKAGFRVGKNHAHVVEHLGKATFKEVDPKDKQYERAARIYERRYGQLD